MNTPEEHQVWNLLGQYLSAKKGYTPTFSDQQKRSFDELSLSDTTSSAGSSEGDDVNTRNDDDNPDETEALGTNKRKENRAKAP